VEINDLIIFKTVVDEGSISKAAKELGYVQPNITERIKKLEQELEKPLLHRNNKGITLLPPGEILLDYANQILNLLENAKREIMLCGESYRIATTQTLLSNYLSVRIKENFQKYQIFMKNSNGLIHLLEKQKVDMAITYGNYTNPVFKKVSSASISMGLLKAKGKSNINYSKELFFVSHDKECPFRNSTIKFMEEHKISKNQLQQIDSYSLIIDLVSLGKGVAFLPISNDQLEIIEEVEIVKIPIYFFTTQASEKVIPSELLG